MQNRLSFGGLGFTATSALLVASVCFSAEARSAHGATGASSDTYSPPPIACPWYLGDDTPADNGSTPADAIRYGWVDLEAGYWGFALDPRLPAGTTKFRINGHFPQARNFSIQLYAGNVTDLQSMTDYQIHPDSGAHSPYTGINTYNTSVHVGDQDTYTIHIVYGVAPSNPAPNTFYVDASQFTSKQYAVFLLRIYNAFAPVTVADHGGYSLPSVVQETNSGDVPLTTFATPTRCDAFLNFRDGERKAVAKFVDTANASPIKPDLIPPNKYLKPPQFQIYETTSSSWLVNDNARYIYAKLSQIKADLVLMRARAPSFATQPGVSSDPQLRHWSVCENAAISFETYSCIEDYKATIDKDGFFNVVLSWPGKKPANANSAHGFDWLAWGTTYTGVPIYRQMLPSPNFTQSAFRVPTGTDPSTIMGDYWMQATYCSKAVFDTHTEAGNTPSQVFDACKAGQ